jgi:hypothetical protein
MKRKNSKINMPNWKESVMKMLIKEGSQTIDMVRKIATKINFINDLATKKEIFKATYLTDKIKMKMRLLIQSRTKDTKANLKKTSKFLIIDSILIIYLCISAYLRQISFITYLFRYLFTLFLVYNLF